MGSPGHPQPPYSFSYSLSTKELPRISQGERAQWARPMKEEIFRLVCRLLSDATGREESS